jgi:preprotein translocase subunit SecF
VHATIEFTRYRLPMMILSLIVIVAGLAMTVQRGGFNLSVDLAGGLSQQIQIARPALVVELQEGAELEVVVQQATDRIVLRATEVQQTPLSFAEYPSLGAMAAAISEVRGVEAARALEPGLASDALLAESPQPRDGRLVLHAGAEGTEPVSIDRVRDALAPLDKFSIKTIGARSDQQFVIRVEVASDDDSELQAVQERVRALLADEFGDDSLILRSTDFVGRRFSQILSQQAVWLVVVALLLIMVYVGVRFRPEYSVGALVAVAHDVLVMIGVLGTFQLEVSTATIAALLTIVGYSLNDTIVIFDRVRENVSLMRDADLRRVIDTSITQSLSRTVITSLTTLLAVVAIFVFATGPIETFALAVIIGVIVGTYSSMYIASPIVLLLQRGRRPASGARAASDGAPSVPTGPTPESGAPTAAAADDATPARSDAPRPAGPRVQPVSKRRNKKKQGRSPQ